MLDLTADKTSAEPPIQMFTLKGEILLLINSQVLVDQMDYLQELFQPVVGSKLINWGLTYRKVAKSLTTIGPKNFF